MVAERGIGEDAEGVEWVGIRDSVATSCGECNHAATLPFHPRHNSRHAMPSTSKPELIATILRTILPQQVPGAEVLPPSTWAEFGLSTSGLKPLPDIVAYSSKGETLFIIQVVHRTGAPSA